MEIIFNNPNDDLILKGVGKKTTKVYERLQELTPYVENDYYVDLGLPSGTLWAKRNIFTGTGNDNGFAPSEYSYNSSFFSRGNVDGHNVDGNDEFEDGYAFTKETYDLTPGSAITGDLTLSYDAAHVNLGGAWRMPTETEFRELFSVCPLVDSNGDYFPSETVDKTITIDDIVGIKFKSTVNNKTLFLPIVGHPDMTNSGTLVERAIAAYYGTVTLNPYYNNTYCLQIKATGTGMGGSTKRLGFPVRPVM